MSIALSSFLPKVEKNRKVFSIKAKVFFLSEKWGKNRGGS
ncbi:hypothetical protein B4090_0836 [Bacillus licheniformis]|nr:hypothetical protein B4090_0836 [Bacillus licheniformis]